MTTKATTTAATSTVATEAATTSAPHESPDPRGRPDGAAAARTEELFAAHRRTVFGLCRALLRDPVEAEDAMQQTFLSAHRALLNGSRPQAPAAWLATIARNECWSRISTRMREPLPSPAVETEAQGSDPLAEALRRADLAALWQAIEALPRAQRDALLLREFGGMSYGELAAALDVSGPAVESLLFRARARLRGQLRTAYAAITGASWLDALARLLAGGGAPAAAKVAVLGVGAAAVGSGVVVVPRAFDNHHPTRAPVVARHEAARHARRRPPAPVLAASVVPLAAASKPAPVRIPPPLRITTEAEHKVTRNEVRTERPGSDGGSRGGAEQEGERQQTQPPPAPVTTAATVESSDGGSAAPSGGSDGGVGGDSLSSDSGDGGDSGGHGGDGGS